jgi:lysyl-tRNA synthetase class 2
MAVQKIHEDRVKKLEKIRELGFDPFGGRFDGGMPLAEARKLFNPDEPESHPKTKVAGRIIFLRDIGKLIFLRLRDMSGEMQIGLSKSYLTENEWKLAKLLDMGDIIGVDGELGVTKTGEITAWGKELTILSKALNPPPEKWHGLTDTELRYRQRYVDLFSNPDVQKSFITRSTIITKIRNFMAEKGYLEVETPMMQAIAGGAAARPFVTHHNALDLDLYLRIAPELYLKRLLVGGFDKVFELNRSFRNEGISPRHNPEFTMLEAYEAFGSWETMADMMEELICHLAQTIIGSLKIEHKNAEGEVTKTIDLTRPWRRVRIVDLVEERTGWKFDKRPLQEAKPELIDELIGKTSEGAILPHAKRSAHAQKLAEYSPAEQLVEVYEKLIEPTLIDPCFVTHIPSVIIPLAKENKDDPFFADVYELAINGQEISPGYSELNDPEVQARHFMHQVGDEDEKQQIDEDFLNALRYGMPPAGGIGLGIDRLIMMLTGAESIRDVILFPLQRPVGQQTEESKKVETEEKA